MLWSELQREVRACGFADCGLVDASDSRRWPRFHEWLTSGAAATMTWLSRYEQQRRHPQYVFPEVRSLLILLFSAENLKKLEINNFFTLQNSGSCGSSCGTILDYAARRDYHLEIRARARRLAECLTHREPDLRFRIAVDTAPLPEKEWAERAGLGRTGRNCLLIHPQYGSRFFIGTMLLSRSIAELITVPSPAETVPAESVPAETCPEEMCPTETALDDSFPLCGSCRKCLNACPTGALNGDGTLDARKCLNYWSIEASETEVPEIIKRHWGAMLFGCDRCQKVCPHNQQEEQFPLHCIPLESIDQMNEDDFKRAWSESPLARIGLSGLQRNANRVAPCLAYRSWHENGREGGDTVGHE